MDKKNIIIFSIIGFVAILALFFISRSLTKDTNQQAGELSSENEALRNDPNLSPMGNQSQFWDDALSPFKDEEPKSYLEIIEDLKTGKINFVWEIWALRRKCDASYTADQCNQTILAYIDANYESPSKEKLKDLFESYFKYEVALHKLEISADVKFDDRYEILKNKRREIMGEEKADLIFGMEESQVQFLEGSSNFIEATKNLNPEDRVRKYNELKKKTYGSYYDAVVSREDKFDHYQTELSLREKEFQSGLSPEEKEKKLAALETRYFGKEKAAELAKVRKEEAQASARIADYEKLERDFLSSNPSLSSKEKEKKIMELRVKAFGEEEAEAYTRRKQFEEETKNL
ncbi:lipase [Leptospira ognonensis]|uniref:Lipase helper protein n=1 Tax=Leptospira ognonensis TaxID=2484945 RepID=A0A4R9K554_9LEPT|nr:lipase secretion chaperone [Leptospira ognonensis]TGL61303.1 lipase [Leptospira ognonensis]